MRFPIRRGRAGKSFILALAAVFLATFHDYRQYLAPGERGTVLVIACDRKQARVIKRYIRALLTKVPMVSVALGDAQDNRPDAEKHRAALSKAKCLAKALDAAIADS